MSKCAADSHGDGAGRMPDEYPNRAAADDLIAKLPMERFACMPSVEDDPEVLDGALGGRDDDLVIAQFWWD